MTAEVPSLVTLDPVCGIENDRLVIGDPVEGVFYDTSEVYIDGTFYIHISPLPGWQFPDGQVTEFALVDEGDCVIEGLTAPIHTEVCGELNDTVEIPTDQDHVTIESTGDMA